MNVEVSSAGRPFCAGVVPSTPRGFLFTIPKPSRWGAEGRQAIPLACIGGGQEPGETIRECAEREAREEAGCPVRLLGSELSVVIAPDGGWSRRRLDDRVPPAVVQLRRKDPAPYKPGLPAGDLLTIAHYEALPLGEPWPRDVPALLELPPGLAAAVRRGITVGDALRAGLRLLERVPVPRSATLWCRPDTPEDRLVAMIDRGWLRLRTEEDRCPPS